MTAVRKKNSQVKVLGLSATPVINNLMEGKPTIPNAVTLYEKLSTISKESYHNTA
jgi:hypothetical protein